MRRLAVLTTLALAAASWGGCGSSSLVAAKDDSSTGETTEGAAPTSTSSTTATGEPATSSGPPETTSGVTSSSTGASSASGSSSSSTGNAESSSESTGSPPEVWEWDLPEGWPEPVVPEDNPMSAAKVELGRHLFYDPRLSGNETQSCASCHNPALAFTDGLANPIGSTGDTVPLNAMSLANVAYSASQTWANPNLAHLSEQAAVPLFGTDPVELGADSDSEEILDRLRAEPVYDGLFADAYPEAADPVSWLNVRRAIASFERTLISGNSGYDRWRAGDNDAISAAAKRGYSLFFSEVQECHHCHNGFNFTNSVLHVDLQFPSQPFFNNGLYNIDGEGGYPPNGEGLFAYTGEPADMGKFKPPTLRNIAVTAPYMHDGSVATLEELVDHYARGGRRINMGPYAGDGSLNPFKSPFVSGFQADEGARADLVAFMEALTDDEFLGNPAFANPW